MGHSLNMALDIDIAVIFMSTFYHISMLKHHNVSSSILVGLSITNKWSEEGFPKIPLSIGLCSVVKMEEVMEWYK